MDMPMKPALFIAAVIVSLGTASSVLADCDEPAGSDVNWSGCDLYGAYLRNADLSGANLSGADLVGADRSDADLTGADLSEAGLTGADLSRADLTGANLSRTESHRGSTPPPDGPLISV